MCNCASVSVSFGFHACFCDGIYYVLRHGIGTDCRLKNRMLCPDMAFRKNIAHLLPTVEVPDLQLHWFGKCCQFINPSVLYVQILLCLCLGRFYLLEESSNKLASMKLILILYSLKIPLIFR